jgi:hypothetical protein
MGAVSRYSSLVVVAVIALVACRWALAPVSGPPAGPGMGASALRSSLAPPLSALAQLLPGLALGWFTPRHPLLVGAAAGLLAIFVAQWLALLHFDAFLLAGNAVAAAMTVAVAALAGRALRRRLMHEPPRHPPQPPARRLLP